MGVKTLYEYFYKLAYGDKGADKATLFSDCLDVADAQIEANKNPFSNMVKCADYDHPDDAITAISTDNKTLLVTESETCDTNFTVPANVTVKFERGGKWTINTGITVTFNGQIDAGLWQIFAYVGTGTLAGTLDVLEIYPEWWGAVGDDSNDDTTAIQNAIDIMGNKGVIRFTNTYRTTSAISLPVTGFKMKLYSDTNATIHADHNGNCIVTTGTNSNYTYHIIEGLTLQGSNTHYPPAEYEPPNTGAGLYMTTTYHSVVRDCIIQGFKYGVYMQTGIGNIFEGNTYLRFNQYGLYIDGGATNANYFDGVGFRENRKHGISIQTTTPTKNSFVGCLIETNIPYPYVEGGAGDGTDSVGIYLSGTYDNSFISCYSENHEFSVYITNSSDGNKFTDCRFAPSADGTRLDKIQFKGASCNSNVFSLCKMTARNNTDVHIQSDADNFWNQFIDCYGFNYIVAQNSSNIQIVNMKSSPTYGIPYGTIVMPTQGYISNPGEGTGRGQIAGIGTASATFNAEGVGEVYLGSLITADTTIDEITNLQKGQFLTIINYQTTYVVTIKSTTTGTSGLMLKGWRDVILSRYSDSITLYCTNLGKIVEVGNNRPNIPFPATQVPSADVNTLDDYEEGEWTIAITFGGNSAAMTYSLQAGLYTKIGRQVTVTGRIVLTAKGSSTGTALIEGLPFTCKDNDGAYSAVILKFTNITFANMFQGAVNKNATTIALREITEVGVETVLDNTNFADNSAIVLSATYFTD